MLDRSSSDQRLSIKRPPRLRLRRLRMSILAVVLGALPAVGVTAAASPAAAETVPLDCVGADPVRLGYACWEDIGTNKAKVWVCDEWYDGLRVVAQFGFEGSTYEPLHDANGSKNACEYRYPSIRDNSEVCIQAWTQNGFGGSATHIGPRQCARIS